MRIVISLLIACTLFAAYHVGAGQAIAEEGGGGDILYSKPVKAVVFSHKVHVEQTGLDCNLCHDKLFQMEALTAEKSGTLNHKSFKEGKYCGACHDGSMTFGNGQCARCHIGVIGYNRVTKSQKESASAGH
ncbi:MAG TPA: c(7)-type cytochrome triheme domain-containing protein [Dissulfurispiraceae bacterium]|nr:c(7)-type cytochrome triheme domain-containing protein [Dissulfurispiraceae bacterium]